MSGDVNKVILIGHLGTDPQRTVGPYGSLTKFRLVTNERRTNREGGKTERTTWFRVIAFDGLADLCYDILHRGLLVFVEGSVETRSYRDQQGVEREYWSIRATEVRSLNSRNEDPTGNSHSTNQHSLSKAG
jgi:single-strand DNA-binding protein